MKLGLALRRHQLDLKHFRFARQCGCTHLVVQLFDDFGGSETLVREQTATIYARGPVRPGALDALWSYEQLSRLVEEANAADLQIEAIENFDPTHWFDVLLGGPRRARQLAKLKAIIRNVGKAGIPVFSYHFSLAGAAGKVRGSFARGDAETFRMNGPDDRPLPDGTLWNTTYDSRATAGPLPLVTRAQLWDRLKSFLGVLLPVAEEAGVTLAAQPDEPPLPTLRGTPQLIYRPEHYQQLLGLHPSPRSSLKFCLAATAEMAPGDVYEAIDIYSRRRKIAYVRVRNVRGKAPYFHETFADDGDIDLLKVVRILQQNRYGGVLVTDQAPHMTCTAPWHAGVAHTLGYLKAALQACEARAS